MEEKMKNEKITKSFIEKRIEEKAKKQVDYEVRELVEFLRKHPIGKLLVVKDGHYLHNEYWHGLRPLGLEEAMKKREEKRTKELSDELFEKINGFTSFLNQDHFEPRSF